MDRTDLAQDTNKWWTLVNMVMNLQVPSNVWNVLTCSGPIRQGCKIFSKNVGATSKFQVPEQ